MASLGDRFALFSKVDITPFREAVDRFVRNMTAMTFGFQQLNGWLDEETLARMDFIADGGDPNEIEAIEEMFEVVIE